MLAYRVLSAAQSETEGRTLRGLVAPYGQPSARAIRLSSDPASPSHVEVITQGAFDTALGEVVSGKRSVRALVNHVPFVMLGSTRAGTVELSSDQTGLRSIITPPSSPIGEELLALGKRPGELAMSFGFKPDTSRHHVANGIRHLTEIDLFEISILTIEDGAYSAANAATRAMYGQSISSFGMKPNTRHTPERDALFAEIMAALRRN